MVEMGKGSKTAIPRMTRQTYSGDGIDDAGGRAHLTHPMCSVVRNNQIIGTIERDGKWIHESRCRGQPTIPAGACRSRLIGTSCPSARIRGNFLSAGIDL